MGSEQLTYSRYLKVSELLELQSPLTTPEAHDELLFIITHQTYELWFKQILHEADSLVGLMQEGDLIHSFRRLNRIQEIFKVLIQQVDVLETMTPIDFNRFRARLNPASGFQSLQFRELELTVGVDAGAYEKFASLEPEWMGKLEARKNGPTLRGVFTGLLRSRGLLTSEDTEAVEDAVLKVYLEGDGGLTHLCEQLLNLDELFSLWRFRHVQMVERMIGMKKGTGGSLGVAYLQATLKKRFFPELWSARTRMNGGTQ